MGSLVFHTPVSERHVRVRHLHRWRVSVAEAAEVQVRLRGRISRAPPAAFRPGVVAGADVSFDRPRGRTRAHAAVVCLRLPDLAVLEEAGAEVEVTFPYVPGYLSFREIPALAAAWRRLRTRPDLLLLDAHGYAHPRRMGLACHAGLVFDLPAIGCAKSILVGSHGELRRRRGSCAALRDGGEVVGSALRTRTGVKPVYVSVGHRMDLSTARRWVLRLTPDGRFRIPEPIRRAHALAGRLKAGGAVRVLSNRRVGRKHT